MRDIKFRAWDKELECFDDVVAGNLLCSLHDGSGWSEEDKQRFVLQEFTGIKNPEEIYEGDILYWQENETMKKGFISYHRPRFIVEFAQPDEEGSTGRLFHMLTNYQVVGNVCENPELLQD